MTRNKLALILALIMGAGAIAGGIVYAQESTAPVALLEAQEPSNPDRSFSFIVSDGAFLGVGTEDISKENMGRYGVREVRGVGVTQVAKDSPAEKAGLKKDDVILRFEGESVTSTRKLGRLVSESSADQTVRITISRGGTEQELTATLAKRNISNLLGASIREDVLRSIEKSWPEMNEKDWPKIQSGDGPFVFSLGANRRIGVSTQNLTKQLADYFGAKDGGVLITTVSENSPAAKAGLKAGDVITAIDGEKVDSSGDITRAINKKREGEISLTVLRDRSTRTVTLTPEKNKERTILAPGTIGTRRVVIPSIQIPEVNVEMPRIIVPATPRIEVTVPKRPARVRTGSRVVII
ncbi:MAG: serine protease Do [Blastocatellia bacterium]|jgi:serine protease Do|nr:serine protease Do [Blastocatellia bacterium]